MSDPESEILRILRRVQGALAYAHHVGAGSVGPSVYTEAFGDVDAWRRQHDPEYAGPTDTLPDGITSPTAGLPIAQSLLDLTNCRLCGSEHIVTSESPARVTIYCRTCDFSLGHASRICAQSLWNNGPDYMGQAMRRALEESAA